MKIYLVGGAVRDAQLGLPIKDRDWVVVGATPVLMLQKQFKPVGKDFPVFLHPETQEEYALARQERKNGRGYHGFEVIADENVTLEDDLIRRDLTINAMAEDEYGRLIDPYLGMDDLQSRCLRHVSDAFREDPVRVLRLARFYARFYGLGFHIAASTQALVLEMVDSGELNFLTPERIWLETLKGLSGEYPDQFIAILREFGALKVILPEVDALFGVPLNHQFQPEVDSGLHTLMMLAQSVQLNADLPTRFACLCHGLGKAVAPERMLPQPVAQEASSEQSVSVLSERLKVPNEYKEIALKVAKYHVYFQQLPNLNSITILQLLQGLDAMRKPKILEQFICACIADRQCMPTVTTEPSIQADFLLNCVNAIKTINIKSEIALHKAPDVKDLVYQLRLKKLESVIKDYSFT